MAPDRVMVAMSTDTLVTMHGLLSNCAVNPTYLWKYYFVRQSNAEHRQDDAYGDEIYICGGSV